MPLISLKDPKFPAWCEVTEIKIIRLGPMEQRTLKLNGPVEKFVAAVGSCAIQDSVQTVLQQGQTVEVRRTIRTRNVTLVGANRPSVVAQFTGRWRQPTGGAGRFTVDRSDAPQDAGDPVWYTKHTNFDRHFHDCDEYWVFVSGRGKMMSEGQFYDVGPGDVIATGMGHHHDIVEVDDSILGVYFETTLEGEQRTGHLWEHTHGPAIPQADRI